MCRSFLRYIPSTQRRSPDTWRRTSDQGPKWERRLCPPPFPRYQQMLISRQKFTGKMFIHLPSLPDIMLLAGKCNSCADLLSDISPPDIMSLAGNFILCAGPFFGISLLHSGGRQILGGGRAIKGQSGSGGCVLPLSPGINRC